MYIYIYTYIQVFWIQQATTGYDQQDWIWAVSKYENKWEADDQPWFLGHPICKQGKLLTRCKPMILKKNGDEWLNYNRHIYI